MLRVDFIRGKIELIQQNLGRLEESSHLTFDEVAKDWRVHSIVENLLVKIIGRGIDINQHLISELVSIKVAAPLDYKETFFKLAELGVLPEKFARQIAESAGFRNVLVHEYNNINEQIFYKSVGETLNQYTKYCDYILKFLEKVEKEKK